jgi:hypothetical protein
MVQGSLRFQKHSWVTTFLGDKNILGHKQGGVFDNTLLRTARQAQSLLKIGALDY